MTGSGTTGPEQRRGADALLAHVEDVAALLAAAALTLIMMIIVVDVFMRYVLNAPLTWAYELISSYLIPVAFFFVLAQTMRLGEHVAVDFFVDLIGPTARRWMFFFSSLSALAIFCVLTLVTGVEAWRSMMMNEHTIGYFVWPIWMSKATVPLGVGLLTLRLLMLLTRPRPAAFTHAAN